MKIILKSKKNVHYAEALYSPEKVVVLAGSKINLVDTFPKMSVEAKNARADRNIVDENGNVIKDVIFKSPSTAAQFVTGRSVNGYISWRPNDEMSLKKYFNKNK